MRRLILTANLLALLGGCEGQLSEPSDSSADRRSGVRTAMSSLSCADLPAASDADLIDITNIAYFEASYLSQAKRAYECGLIAGCILARAYDTGESFTGVITAPNQFETYSVIHLTVPGVGKVTLAAGIPADQATSPAVDAGGYAACKAAVTAALQNTPASGYYFFHAAGNGTNSFNTPKAIPSGCDLLSGGAPAPAPQPAPAPAQPPTAAASASCAGICGYQSPQGCYCDTLCSQYGDCCSDHAASCGGGGSASAGTSGCSFGSEGNNGDSCDGVPAETWRCVWSSDLGGNASQVCRGGVWVSFHMNPAGCASCCGTYSASCK